MVAPNWPAGRGGAGVLRFVPQEQAQLGVPEPVAVLGRLGRQLLLPGGPRVGAAPQFQQQPSQALPRLDPLFGEESRGLPEFVNGLGETALVFEGDGKKVVRPAVVGVDANRFPKVGDRLVVAAALPGQGEP